MSISPKRRRILGWLRLAVALALLAAWFVFLRPQGLGGPADYVMVSGTSMLPTMESGDLVVVTRRASYSVGDVVAFRVPEGDVGGGQQVIHRIIDGSARKGFVLQGDNRSAPDVWRPRPEDIVGAEWVRIPYAGTLLLFARNPFFVGPFAAFLFIGLALLRRRPDEATHPAEAWGECAWTARDLGESRG
jgi:signal peptidase I